jgi:hypothetical protein
MAQVPGDERCKHGEIAAWCGESQCMAARAGLPVRVSRTPFGSAYHRTPTCQALLEGHRMAQRYGHETHPGDRRVAVKDEAELRRSAKRPG